MQANELRTLQLNSPKVNYVQQGSGAPVILTHGLVASLHDWDDLLPELAASGYAGYALDLLGHGESEKPSHYYEYTAAAVFGHFEAWIASLQLDEPMILIGHSLGAGLSMLYALRYPERVRGLVLANPFYQIDQLPRALRTVFLRQLLNTHLINITPYRFFRFFVDITSFNVYIGARETHTLPEHIRYQTALDYKRASFGIYNIPRTLPDLTPELPHLHQPTLLLWGNRDKTLAGSSFLELSKLIPNLKGTHILPVCGHVPHQCHPRLFNPHVIKFLQALSEAEPLQKGRG